MKKFISFSSFGLTGSMPLLTTCLALCLICFRQPLFAQCPGDVTPPVPVCVTGLNLDVPPAGGPIQVNAQGFNNGSSDNCSSPANLQFFIEEGAPSATPPSTTQLSFTAAQAGSHPIVMWVVDEAGNAAFCTSTLVLTVCQTALAMVCNDHIYIDLGIAGTAEITPDDMLEGGPYCNYNHYTVDLAPLGNPTPTITVSAQDIGDHIMQVTHVETGNACWGTVTVQGDCVNDLVAPVAVCDAEIAVVLDTAAAATFTLTPAMVDDGSYDNCTPQPGLDFRLEDLAQSNNTPPASQSLTLGVADVGSLFARMWVGDAAGNWNSCLIEVTVSLVVAHQIEGSVFLDGNGDCQWQPVQENGLDGWTVRATGVNTGAVFVAATDAQGHYNLSVNTAETAFEVVLDAPYNYGGQNCGTNYIVTFSNPNLSAVVDLDIPVVLDDECPLLFVDLATPKIRPCFPGTYYVYYANASTQSIAGTYIDVTLDEDLAYQSSNLPAVSLGNQVFRFETGDLDAGASGWISINFFTDCGATLGATHCSEAHIYPDTLCPSSPFWSGANVEVAGFCQNDSIFLSIRNTGVGPNAQPLDFIVVEDVLMRETGNFSLPPGQVLNLDPIAGDGSTFRLQAQQEPGHPYGGMPAVAVEGCGGFTAGLVTLFPTNNANPFIAVDCRENTSSFDPNDKQALPRGYADEHFIDKNTPLDYMIRFQNTGTDTAFRVVIVDTLSALLDASKVRPGASSHPYRFELQDGHILHFIFDDILLPDSNVNAAASQGFIQFSVPQVPDNPEGARIENTAAIYFDVNAPVITNQTFHTVGDNFILVSTDNVPGQPSSLQVYPNPASDRVFFDANRPAPEALRFTLTDAQGRLVRETGDVRLPMTFERGQLPAGVYFFRFTAAQGQLMWSGKVVVR